MARLRRACPQTVSVESRQLNWPPRPSKVRVSSQLKSLDPVWARLLPQSRRGPLSLRSQEQLSKISRRMARRASAPTQLEVSASHKASLSRLQDSVGRTRRRVLSVAVPSAPAHSLRRTLLLRALASSVVFHRASALVLARQEVLAAVALCRVLVEDLGRWAPTRTQVAIRF